jgi:hypothetical protein
MPARLAPAAPRRYARAQSRQPSEIFLVLEIVVGAFLGTRLLRRFPAHLHAVRERVAAAACVLALPLAAGAARWAQMRGASELAWLLAAVFFVSAPMLYKRAGEDLDHYTDSVMAQQAQPSRLRLTGLALFALSIIVAGALMLLVVDGVVAQGDWQWLP